MKPPGGNSAIVDRDKLVGYCLDPDHPRGKHKARVFESVLGFTAENAEELREALLRAAATEDAKEALSDRFGRRYMIDFGLSGPTGTATIRSTWILRHGEDTSR